MVFAKLSVDNRIYEQGHQYDVDEKIGFHAKNWEIYHVHLEKVQKNKKVYKSALVVFPNKRAGCSFY